MIKIAFIDLWGTTLLRRDKSFVEKVSDRFDISYNDLRFHLKTKEITGTTALVEFLEKEFSIIADQKIIGIIESESILTSYINVEVFKVLHWLKSEGIQICAYSNCTYLTRRILDHYNIKFDNFWLSYEQGKLKPDLGFLRSAIEEMSIVPRFACVIGDDYEKDIYPGTILGMNTIRSIDLNGELISAEEIIDSVKSFK